MFLLTTYLCDAVAHSKYLLFSDNIKTNRATKSSEDCNQLRSDINSVQCLCIANYIELNIIKLLQENQRTDVWLQFFQILRKPDRLY
jgi:hypothetical protein